MATYRMRQSSEYIAWAHMKKRCFNPNDKDYSNYGGRGITVCDRWLSFENFFADMGSRPSPKHSLDRINNNDDYCYENCKWSTSKEQNNNRRSNRFITINSKTLTIAQWERKQNFNEGVIKRRLSRRWSEYDAVMIPVHTDKRITIYSKTLTIIEWAKEMNFSKSVIQNRLSRGWSEHDAILTPVRHKTKKL